MYQEILTLLSKLNDARRLIIIFIHNSAFCVSVDFTSSMNGKLSTLTSTNSNCFRNFCFYPIQVDIRSYRLNKLYKLETALYENKKQMKTLFVAKGYEVRW